VCSSDLYFYSTYDGGDELRELEGERVMILGAGPNRIGQGIEFDYCCCHAVFADGDGVSVLDQVEARIVRFDASGHALTPVPIPTAATWDAVPYGGDGYGLLAWTPGDDAHWSLQAIDGAGALQAELPVALDPPTAVLVDGDRLLVEDRHDDTVDVATGERFPGRPTGDGWYVKAEKEDVGHLRLTWTDARGGDVREVRLAVDRPLVNVVSLEPREDEVLVGMLLMENGTDEATAAPELRAVLIDRKGHLRRELRLPAGEGTDPQRPLALSAEGDVLQLQPHRLGVSLSRVRR
jgi:hypothetical protein